MTSPAPSGRSTGGRRLRVEIEGGSPLDLTWQQTFGRVPVGEPLLYQDSLGTLAVADNQGNIAERLGLVVDQPIAHPGGLTWRGRSSRSSPTSARRLRPSAAG